MHKQNLSPLRIIKRPFPCFDIPERNSFTRQHRIRRQIQRNLLVDLEKVEIII